MLFAFWILLLLLVSNHKCSIEFNFLLFSLRSWISSSDSLVPRISQLIFFLEKASNLLKGQENGLFLFFSLSINGRFFSHFFSNDCESFTHVIDAVMHCNWINGQWYYLLGAPQKLTAAFLEQGKNPQQPAEK